MILSAEVLQCRMQTYVYASDETNESGVDASNHSRNSLSGCIPFSGDWLPLVVAAKAERLVLSEADVMPAWMF